MRSSATPSFFPTQACWRGSALIAASSISLLCASERIRTPNRVPAPEEIMFAEISPGYLVRLARTVSLLTALAALLSCGGNAVSNAPQPDEGVFGRPPRIAGCQVFPADNAWNRDVSGDPVDPNSAAYIASINQGAQYLHADFGSNPTYGIPYAVVPADQPLVPIVFTEYPEESDPGPYPVPPDAPVEGGSDSTGDRHVLVLQRERCMLYELYHAYKDTDGPGWQAGSGAVFDLSSNKLRPDGWTSADAAGLPILPGLVRYDEVAAGEIRHALRFTVWRTQRGYVRPATHAAGATNDPAFPPMGMRVRLKASYDISSYKGQARVILNALKRYGMIVADNGSSWFITGAPDARWNDADLDQLKSVPGSAFEVIRHEAIIPQ